jgi:hypothetical protein
MVLGLPRSGTAWAANWLTTDRSLCLHEPLFERHYEDIDGIVSDKVLGVACTGLPAFPSWVNAHPARKVILHRDRGEIDESLEALGFDGDLGHIDLDQIEGLHVHWLDLFERPDAVWSHVFPDWALDVERHAMLRRLRVQIDFEEVVVNKDATARVVREMVSCLM